MTNHLPYKVPFRSARLLVAAFAIAAFGACLRQRYEDRGVVPSTPLSNTAPPARSAPNLTQIAERVAKKYGGERYISFKAHVENHESILPGWTVKPGGGIALGSVFEVVMSAAGDIRGQLLVSGQPVYEFQVAVQAPGSESERSSTQYLVREYDHLNKVRAEPRMVDNIPRSMVLSHEALEHPAWCANGAYMTTYVGESGKVADMNNETAYAYQIARGTYVSRQRLADGTAVDVIKFVQQEAAGPRLGPAGQTLEASPAIWWYIYVDPKASLVVQQDGYFEHLGKDPVLVRQQRFSDIEFPSHLNEEIVFRSIPEAARSYRVWKPGEPYPAGQPHADRTSDGVEK